MPATTHLAASAARTVNALRPSTRATKRNASVHWRRRSTRWSLDDLALAVSSLNASGVGTETKPTTGSALSPSKSGARRNKYNARATVVDGIRFDSLAEARRYETLRLLERANEIRDLRVHTAWTLRIGERRICKYECDFEYWATKTGEHVVEDVKGHITREYRIKRELMLALYGIHILEVKP